MNNSINFILPFKPRRPAGGFRVIYEYANRLAENGYKVHLTFPIDTPYMKYRLPYFFRKLIAKVEGFDKDCWFEFDPSVTMSYVPRVQESYIIDADIIVTTWWSTVLEVSKLSPQKGKIINLIQGYENWEGHEDLLFESYKSTNVNNIVVAKYLQQIINTHTDKPCLLIPNAISDEFLVTIPIENRDPLHIIMTYSEQEIKGSIYGLQALKIVKEKYPELKVTLFGVCPVPVDLPDWIIFYRNPSNLCELYNRNSIILSNSFTEGFPLTPAEGMKCGCALICTDIDGHREYAKDNDTAMFVPIKQPAILANCIIDLISDNDKRILIAKNGKKYIQRFSWENSYQSMQHEIQRLLTM